MSNSKSLAGGLLAGGLVLVLSAWSLAGPISIKGQLGLPFGVDADAPKAQRLPWYIYFPANPYHNWPMGQPGIQYPNWPQTWPPTTPNGAQPVFPQPQPFPLMPLPLPGTPRQTPVLQPPFAPTSGVPSYWYGR